jgi:uncharacterized protein (DUF1501 family)
MLDRRAFFGRALRGSSLFAAAATVPGFLARTAAAAEPGKETVLVVLELTGGNDGLNTVIPYADELYYQMRPSIGQRKEQVIKVDNSVGLHPSLNGLNELLQNKQLAVVQGVGYPNPNRSHFESMDVWQAGEVGKPPQTGWLARSASGLIKGGLAVLQVGPQKLPLALRGSNAGIFTLNQMQPLQLDLGRGRKESKQANRKLLDDVASGGGDDLTEFVRRRQLQTYTAIDQLREIVGEPSMRGGTRLQQQRELIARIIMRGPGVRVFYAALDGFDTHSGQLPAHANLMAELSGAVNLLFQYLKPGGDDKRVIVMTFSEFGRRVRENGSGGTDHGAASCLFVGGPAVAGGVVGKHPSLADLDDGDLKMGIDFRRVYATLLDGWLGCESRAVLGARFEHLPLLKAKA